MSFRTPLGKVKGLGSAKEGTKHWWYQRLTALALVPLSLWFAISVMTYASADYQSALEWMASPVITTLFLMLVVALFYHAQLGLQVVIEDYVHMEWLKIGSLIAVKFACIVLATLSVVCVIRLSLGN